MHGFVARSVFCGQKYVTNVARNRESQSSSRTVRECCDYIRANVTKPLTANKSVAEISDALQFSNRNYFTKIFTDIAGMTPTAYRGRIGR